MLTYFNERAQLYYSIYRDNGRVYLGYSSDRQEAMQFCWELIHERKKEIENGQSKRVVH
jgi:hypothetical protein